MSEWQAGDTAMVKVTIGNKGHGNPTIGISGPNGNYDLPARCLHPLPPAKTPEERAVLQAALWWRAGFETVPTEMGLQALASATRALIASRTPPDPLAELVEAVTDYLGRELGDRGNTVEHLVNALSAARKAVAK